jgi:hypothetical protein
MSEAFLHYVWQFQYFNKSDLRTTDGEPVSIFTTGFKNTHAGPDFFNAKVKIGDMEWVGNVEIHIHASEWNDHHHNTDDAYENVVLHVVWKADKIIRRKDTSVLPALELKDRVSDSFLLQYRQLINTPETIPCAALIDNVSSLIKFSMLDKALMERLETKATQLYPILQRNHNDWEETAYQMLCRNFGFKVNAEPFARLGLSLPYKAILKHTDKLVQVEALLFGCAGFLEDKSSDDYYLLLKREYALLAAKYKLLPAQLQKVQWRFLRLRPANFPTLRLAQLSALLCNQKNLFSRMLEANTYEGLLRIFSVKQSEYWQHHYQFSDSIPSEVASLGASSIENIIINTVVPLLVAYGKTNDEQRYVDKAVAILQHIGPEQNAIMRNWNTLGIKPKSAGDSQALIELHNNFCLKRRCLECAIGFSILQPAAS